MCDWQEYEESERFWGKFEKTFPWVLLVFFLGLASGYAWAWKHFG